MSGEAIRLGSVSDFPEGEGVRVTVEELPVPVAVFNVEKDFCPHKDTPLSHAGTTPETSDMGAPKGKLDPEERIISCPCME